MLHWGARGDRGGGEGDGGGGGGGGDGGGDGGGGDRTRPSRGRSKQMMKPPRTTIELVDHSSRVPAGVALRFAIALNAAKPDVVPLHDPPREHEAQFG